MSASIQMVQPSRQVRDRETLQTPSSQKHARKEAKYSGWLQFVAWLQDLHTKVHFEWSVAGDEDVHPWNTVFTPNSSSFTVRHTLQRIQNALSVNIDMSVWDTCITKKEPFFVEVALRNMHPGLTSEEALIGVGNLNSAVNTVRLKCADQKSAESIVVLVWNLRECEVNHLLHNDTCAYYYESWMSLMVFSNPVDDNCSVPCRLEFDRRREFDGVDAILYQGNGNREEDIPWTLAVLPSNDKIPWIITSQESVTYYPQLEDPEFMHHFTYSATYRLDSDFPIPHWLPLNGVKDLIVPTRHAISIPFCEKYGMVFAMYSSCEAANESCLRLAAVG